MNVLVGSGAHAQDIYPTLQGHWRVLDHHSRFTRAHDTIIGINDPRTRAEIAEKLGVRDLSWFHPQSFISTSCDIAHGVHVNYGASMTRTTVGKHSTISPGVTICGGVRIGERVLIGAGATVCDRVTIADDATVGAGSTVLPLTEIGPGETWVGTPARKVHP